MGARVDGQESTGKSHGAGIHFRLQPFSMILHLMFFLCELRELYGSNSLAFIN